jgi:cytochrome c553
MRRRKRSAPLQTWPFVNDRNAGTISSTARAVATEDAIASHSLPETLQKGRSFLSNNPQLAPAYLKRALGTLIACAVVCGVSAVVAAESSAVKPVAPDDLRAVYALPPDIAEGKRVAQKSCAACHGIDGIAAVKGVPHLAGQRAPYLHFELKAYQAGARDDARMTTASRFLSEDALIKVAAYYASLDPPAPARTGKSSSGKPDALSAGKAAAAGCAGCHGETGISSTPGTPSLVGLDPTYIASAINAYKHGQRKNDMMQALVSGLSSAETKNLALFYALQKPARARTPAPGDAAAGKAAAEACAGCHGEQGVSASATTPSLAGQDAQYFAAALQAYKNGSRSAATMKTPAAALDDKAIKNLSAYYASLTPQAPKVVKPLTTSELTERCDRCHGLNGNSIDPRTPALASQRADYIESVLLAYKRGARKSPQMAAMSGVLGEEDITGLAAHYARQKARAVVYVPVPVK